MMVRFVMMKILKPKFMTTRIMTVLMAAIILPATIMSANAQSSDSNAALMARQQMRLNTIEDNLKTVRGTLETEFRAIRMKIEELGQGSNEINVTQAAKIKELKGQILELGDTLDIFNQRLRRSIELSSDIEFRVLRMEKRMQTLLSLSGDNISDAILQEDVNAGGSAPAVSMSRDNNTGGGVWTVEKDEALAGELAKSQAVGDNQTTLQATDTPNDNASQIATDTQAAASNDGPENVTENVTENGADNVSGDEAIETLAQGEPQEEPQEEPASVLPEGSPEEQYRFAFGRMLQNDLEQAEAGFAEFRQTHDDHERSADVLYWLGRVQFIKGDYGKSAMSFTEFNSEFPEDSRLPEAILMIAESVLNFATAEQACQIFSDLPQMLDQPSESFVTRLAELKTAAACAS